MQQPNRSSFVIHLLQLVPTYYNECSESTQAHFRKLAHALLFSVLAGGSILSASFCEFWLGHRYEWFPLVLVGTGLFYYLLDLCLIMGEGGGSRLPRLRLFIALVLAFFNSLLLDYYFFRDDIVAARKTEIRHRQEAVAEDYHYQVNLREGRRAELLAQIDAKESQLSAQLDSLNLEANGLGGSGRRGVAAVWTAKYHSYRADSLRVAGLVESKKAEAAALALAIKELRAQSAEEQAAVAATVSRGLNQSLQLLHRVVWKEGSFTSIFMSVLILAVSMLVELVPLVAKSYYRIDEYTAIAQGYKEVSMVNAGIRKQNFVHLEAARLVSANALQLAVENGNHRLELMAQDLAYNKAVMRQTETFMNELQAAEQRWQELYPNIYESYGHPVVDHAYQTLSAATARAYS